MFDVPAGYTTATVRFLPFAHTSTPLDPRFFVFCLRDENAATALA